MLYATLKTIHLLAIIVWLGGMAFALFFLRPAAASLEPAVRLPLLHDVLNEIRVAPAAPLHSETTHHVTFSTLFSCAAALTIAVFDVVVASRN